MYAPAYGVFTLSRRATMAYVHILHPFRDRTFHKAVPLHLLHPLFARALLLLSIWQHGLTCKGGVQCSSLGEGGLSTISLGTPCSVPYWLCGP